MDNKKLGRLILSIRPNITIHIATMISKPIKQNIIIPAIDKTL